MKLSVIIPVYNEEGNLVSLADELLRVSRILRVESEIIFINDGSTDGSYHILKKLANEHFIRVINFEGNFGQTAAMAAGIEAAEGEIIVTMDADLQNDPADIPRLLEKIEEGFDVVSGWRKDRQDALLKRKLPSWAANRIISFFTNVRLHDYGCTLKAYRAPVIKSIPLYGEMHRFIPAYASWKGVSKIVEIPVNHRPRIHGTTKYGLSRTPRVILDLLVFKFHHSFLDRPIHFFGGAGIIMLLLGFVAGIWALYLKFASGLSFISTPLPLLVVFLVFIGVQFILMGILAEMFIRLHQDSGRKKIYTIKEVINFERTF
ncbi:glycosyltransferase family 2 protein [bacterium]|nr:glycosyltransferase family 2 protein [bacterium]MCI0680240.1 glycosyltransferase family 2 protein [bacterium]